MITVSDIGRIIRREERSGTPEDAPVTEPAPSQPEPAPSQPEPAAVPA